MKNYTLEPKTVNIQQYGLEILSMFHEICEVNNLKYILDFGTLLGAVRHQGFIPWDDDIDVAMPRKDFEKFKKIAKKELPENMFLQTHETDSNYYNRIAKIRIPDARYTEYAMQYFDIVHGPWLDIFVYDYKHDDSNIESKKQKVYNQKRNFYPRMMELLIKNQSTDYNLLQKNFKKLLRFSLKKSQRRKTRGFLMRYLDHQYVKLEQFIKNGPVENNSGEMITYTFPIHSLEDEKGLRLNIHHFHNRRLQLFENYSFYIPVDYKKILTDRYGNYQLLPPYKERKSNHQWVNS